MSPFGCLLKQSQICLHLYCPLLARISSVSVLYNFYQVDFSKLCPEHKYPDFLGSVANANDDNISDHSKIWLTRGLCRILLARKYFKFVCILRQTSFETQILWLIYQIWQHTSVRFKAASAQMEQHFGTMSLDDPLKVLLCGDYRY